MNEDEMQALEPQAGESLERMLARYARVRLDPSAAQARRTRAAVMEAAWRLRFERAASADAAASASADAIPAAIAIEPAAAAPPSIATRRRRSPFTGWGARRLGGVMAAAVLAGLMVASTVFAASRAGGPLYEARLALEDVGLPADPAARVEAEIARAQQRLAEIVDASTRGDGGAMAAALGAYERTVNGLATTTGSAAARAMTAVASHREVLLRVAADAPVAARPGLDRALSAGDAAIDRLTIAGGGPQGPGAGGAQNGEGQGGAPGNPGANGAGNGNENGGNPGGNGGAPGGNGAGNGSGPGTGTGGGPRASVPPQPGATTRPGRTPAPKPTKDPGDSQESPGAPESSQESPKP